jgi:PAS domain S-box-containing protein
VRTCLDTSHDDELRDTVELLVSEVVTNALVHAGTDIEVACTGQSGVIRVAVSDGSRHTPSPRAYGPHAGTGRGLRLLEELADEWGVDRSASGKTVWFSVGNPAARPPESPWDLNESHDRGDAVVEVVLLNLPLLLVRTWKQHAETLLREYLLATLETSLEEDAILVHAHASAALGILDEHVPVMEPADDLLSELESLSEPRVTAPRVSVTIPIAAVPHFAELDEALERALAMARRGELLNTTTQPEVRALRRWLCAQVCDQHLGAQPQAWDLNEQMAMSVFGTRVEWDLEILRRAEGAVVAVDDTGTILTATEEAEVLLGYGRGELDGGRLLQLIPERYRQAHLAGFAMYQMTGTTRLIGQTIRVPALTRHGDEAPISLLLSAVHDDAGRTVFLAQLS